MSLRPKVGSFSVGWNPGRKESRKEKKGKDRKTRREGWGKEGRRVNGKKKSQETTRTLR